MRVSAENDTPPRPSLPPVLLAGLALWGGVALAYPRLRGVGASALVALAVAALAAGVAAALWCVRRKAVLVAAIVVLGLLAAVLASALAAWGLAGAASAATTCERTWQCTLTTDAKASEFGASATARASCEDGAADVRLNLPAEGEDLLRGDVLVVRGAVRAPSEASAEYFWNAGLAGSLAADERACKEARRGEGVAALRRQAIEVLARQGGPQAGLVQALVCGYRPTIEASGAYEQFKTVGLAHLVAVSGAHLSIVTLFVAGLLRAVRLSRRATAVATAVFLSGYVCFTGMPVSALRAAFMAASGLLALVADRRASALSALGLCIVVFVGLDAPTALSASFVLSAGSTLGIVLLCPLFASAFASLGRRARTLLVDPLALTASSALATQPYAAALFAQVPLLSPLANLVAAPLFTLGCVVGFVAVLLACALPACAPFALGCADAAAAPLSLAVSVLAMVPGSCLPVDADAGCAVCLSAALVAVLWVWWPTLRPKALAAALAALLALGGCGFAAAPTDGLDEIVMLDVGQGDCFLVRSQGSTLVIDTGNQDGLLKQACAREGVRSVDRVIVSHPDDDHCGSLQALGDVAVVGGLLVADDLLSCPCDSCTELVAEAAAEGYGAGIAGLKVGDRVVCGRFTLEVIWPGAFEDEGGNADSLSLVCSWDADGDGEGEWSALFCGDAEAEQLRAMEPQLPEGGVDVLKVGHHGSRKSLDADLARRLSPSVALIGVGEHNRYGHPAPEVCAALEDAGCAVFRSDREGDVTVAFSAEKLTVSTQCDAEAA